MRKLAVLAVITALSSFGWAGDTKAEHLERVEKADKVFREIMSSPDSAIPEQVLDGAKCVAVVPGMFKAGFIFGGRHGEGLATCKLSEGKWSAPAFFTVTGGSWGAQIGAQSIDLVMMIMNEDGMKGLLTGQFEVGGNVSAAAGPVGRDASGKIGWDSAILTYSRTQGIFVGAVLEGAKISQDEDATEDVYGKEDLSFKRILAGEVQAPAGTQQFVETIAQAKQLTEGSDLPAADRPEAEREPQRDPDTDVDVEKPDVDVQTDQPEDDPPMVR